MAEQSQQQGSQQQQSGQQQQQGEQQQQSPVQLMGRALTNIRKVQNFLEMNQPGQTQAIQMQREAGDLVWQLIQAMQQDQQGSG
ncbi:MAG TPA: hypothetical protein VK869_00235 [Rubrobacteraceae bacterium]|nr:hypothetical protein [Rubrobacteraceae bacterium]